MLFKLYLKQNPDLQGRGARTLAPTRAPKTLAALLAAGGLVLAAPLLPQTAIAANCGTILISTIAGAGPFGYQCDAGSVRYTFLNNMAELDNVVSTLSVQVFRDGVTIADHDIVRDTGGWKVVAIRPDGWGNDGPLFATPEDAARHFAMTI